MKPKVKISSNQFAVEFAACERFHIDPIIQIHRPREYRKVLAGFHVGKNTLDKMYAHDTKPKSKPKAVKKPRH